MFSCAPHEQDVILNAHPRIGEVKGLSLLSSAEQAARATPAEVLQDLARLNAEYESKFGFKFVVFVNGRSREEIVPELRRRLLGHADSERATGIKDMVLIARDRLRKMAEASKL